MFMLLLQQDASSSLARLSPYLPATAVAMLEGGTIPTFAAAALVQAALNALSCSAGSEPLQMAPTDLATTTPVAAAVVVQVC